MEQRYVWVANASAGYHKKWRRASVRDLTSEKFKKWAHDKKDIFFSVQEYGSMLEKENESFFQPIVFDFDSEDPVAAIYEAQALVGFLTDNGVTSDMIRINLSGAKGCHVRCDPYAFGVVASPRVHLINQAFAQSMAERLKLKTMDLSIYSVKRVMRVVGSLHGKSGMRAMSVGTDEFLAASPEELLSGLDGEGSIESELMFFEQRERVSDAAAFYEPFIEQTNLRLSGEGDSTGICSDPGGLPLCFQDWAASEPSPCNDILLQISIGFRAMGRPKEQVREALKSWKNPKPSTINSAYTGNMTHYCAATRKLGAPCDAAKCEFIQSQDTSPSRGEGDGGIPVSLEEAVQSSFARKRIAFMGIVSQRSRVPSIIPTHGNISCVPGNDSPCDRCPLQKPAAAQIDLTKKPELLAEAAVIHKKELRKKVFMQAARIPPKCPGCKLKVTQEQNSEILTIQPDFRHGNTQDTSSKFRENYVLLVGKHKIDAYHAYQFGGETVPWPNSDVAYHVCTKSKQIESSYERFEMNKENYEALEKFQLQKNQSIEDKINEILRDYEVNLHRIRGRFAQALAILLTFHSAINFRFMNKLVTRGWVETLLFGDTAQGKSALVKAFMELYQCGEMLTGEAVTRAGLLCGIDRQDGQFVARAGAFVRNNRGIICIDEYHETPPDLKKAMSDCRTNGIIKSTQIIPFIAEAMLRKIFCANGQSHHGKSIALDQLAFGVKHVENIMVSPEDVRRLDLAIPFEESSEIRSKMNLFEEGSLEALTYDQHSSMLLCQRSHSRKARDISFSATAEKACLHFAKKLSSEYSSEIPLLDAGETKFRLARLSEALAAVLFSTKSDGNQVLITDEHVNFTHQFINGVYSGKAMRYDEYSNRRNEGQILKTGYLRSIGADLRELGPFGIELIEFLSTQTESFTPHDIAAIGSVEMSRLESEEKAHKALATLRKEHMIDKSRGGFILNRRGQQINKHFQDFIKETERHPAEFDVEVEERFEDLA